MKKRIGRFGVAIVASAIALGAGLGSANAEELAEQAEQIEQPQGEQAKPSGGLVLQMAKEELVRDDAPTAAAATGPDIAGEAPELLHEEQNPAAPPAPINWWKGLIGEREGTEEGLLWRAPGTPPPFAATLFNFAVFAFIIVRFGAKPLGAALAKRKETIMRDIDEAQRMREASEKRLREYEVRLEKIEEDLERVRREFREQGEREHARILAEANERRERMKKDAEFLLSQELKQMRQDLLEETVDQALLGASELLRAKLTPAEQDRYLEAFLLQLPARSGSGKGAEAVAAKGGMSS